MEKFYDFMDIYLFAVIGIFFIIMGGLLGYTTLTGFSPPDGGEIFLSSAAIFAGIVCLLYHPLHKRRVERLSQLREEYEEKYKRPSS